MCSTQTPGVVFLISPCSIRKNAPILLTASGFEAEVNAYITANLAKGGTVYVLGAPLILTDNVDPSAADGYVKNMAAGIVIGGEGLISDAAARAIFDLAADVEITDK